MGKYRVAESLLKTEAVRLNVKTPFTFVSGIKSPIYCDNRKMIGYPEARNIVVTEFVNKIKEMANSGKTFEIIAGTATAGIPWAAFIAQEMNLPMSYIRSEKKAHGAGRQIEGADLAGKTVLVIEDLVSTGGSSIKAAQAALEAGAEKVELLSIFSYDFQKAFNNFKEAGIEWNSLSNFQTLLEVAEKMQYISRDEMELASSWNKAPEKYGI
ncbi:MAG: orotate phosphoribosyltransferase [Fusobacteriaceae bacterium]